jgi:hypothetical protein
MSVRRMAEHNMRPNATRADRDNCFAGLMQRRCLVAPAGLLGAALSQDGIDW